MAYDLAKRSYIRYAPNVFKVPETEREDIQAITKLFNLLINGDFDKHGHSYPTTHARTLGVVKGKLIVPESLPQHLKQGLFATPGEYPVVMRYSTVSHDAGADDRVVQPRAVTVKIFNADGERFPEGAGNRTQDFELNSGATISDLPDARTARKVIEYGVKALSAPQPPAAPKTDASEVKYAHVESLPLYSQVAYRFGDYMCKHRLFPATDLQNHATSETAKPDQNTSTVMRNWLQNYYEKNEATYEWQTQLCENLGEQPVEFAGKVWDEKKYPFQTIGKLVFPKQDSMNYELKAFWEDHLRSDSWRGLKSFEPIGGTNRVRRALYPYSRQMREKLNGRQVIDVQRLEDLPGPIPDGIVSPYYFQSIGTRLRGHIGSYDIGTRVWK